MKFWEPTVGRGTLTGNHNPVNVRSKVRAR
jgi:hypothetical protein